MSSSYISSLNDASKQITIYVGIPTLIAGILGGLLNTIVFLSLRTFRESPCAFYLTIMSIVNVGQMITGLLARILTSGFNIDWSLTSLFYCKFRLYCFQVCALISMTCICLAIIDQYLITCSRQRWQQWSNMTIARCLSAIFILIWILHTIPYLIYYNHVISNTTSKVTCIVTNNTFQQYVTFGLIFIIGKLLPICMTFLFGILAYRNLRQMSHRALPIVRRELDKQLTVMVLVLVVCAFFMNMPYTIVYLLTAMPQLTQNPIIAAQLQFASNVTTYLVYMYFASPFYIFLCVSDRFRRQLIYVLFDVYLNKWRQQRQILVNKVKPQLT
ncbi:unnamed protein product [Adineta steineri]|uniref:G-protein coupled receptors family 1 profile domain-containing protein n=1 Tax=Adineta steineri TaxID=433720 RepID=A0A816EJA2_9BILA|nr:unnamed protein product [Adineta steineri]CAF1650897.1 unnamed protein product [Adineta steineri]